MQKSKSESSEKKKERQIKRHAFCLGDSQRQEIRELRIISPGNEESVFSSLEHLMNVESWFELGSRGEIKRTKKAARIARNYQQLSESLKSLGATLKKLDPFVLHDLNDTFSFIQFAKIKKKSDRISSSRVVLLVDEFISETHQWAINKSECLNGEAEKSYYFRFFDELANFWHEDINENSDVPNPEFRKLSKILLRQAQDDSDGAFDETCKKQIDRWSKAKKLSKGQVTK
jgi:hypothetical protein